MKNTLQISVLITTFNAIETIDRLIHSLEFAKEIIIIDSFSKDDTFTAAAKYDNVTIYKNEFTDFLSQRDFAISKSTNDWVVFVDQDEEIPETLSKEIDETPYISDNHLYLIKRDAEFMGKTMKSNSQTKNDEIIIYNKNKHKNSNIITNTPKEKSYTINLKNKLNSYTTFDNYTRRLHNKSTLEAKALYHKKKKPSLYHFLILPFIQFWKQFLFNLRFLDKKEGFVLSYITAFSVFKRYINLWLMYRKIE